MVKARIDIFKYTPVTVDNVEVELLRLSGSEEIDLPDDLVRKMLENEDVAQSFLTSLLSSYGADLVRLNLKIDGYEHDYAASKQSSARSAVPILVVPRIAKVNRIMVVPKSIGITGSEGSDITREIKIGEGDGSTLVINMSSEPIYVFEMLASKTALRSLQGKIVVLDTDAGVASIDVDAVLERVASITEEKSSSKKSKSTRKKKRSHKRRRVSAK